MNGTKAKKRPKPALSRKNFRGFARKVVERYAANGMLADALVWGEILDLYEAELKEASR